MMPPLNYCSASPDPVSKCMFLRLKKGGSKGSGQGTEAECSLKRMFSGYWGHSDLRRLCSWPAATVSVDHSKRTNKRTNERKKDGRKEVHSTQSYRYSRKRHNLISSCVCRSKRNNEVYHFSTTGSAVCQVRSGNKRHRVSCLIGSNSSSSSIWHC